MHLVFLGKGFQILHKPVAHIPARNIDHRFQGIVSVESVRCIDENQVLQQNVDLETAVEVGFRFYPVGDVMAG